MFAHQFTIENALNLPIFSGAIVVASRGGLGHQINWVHVLDIPNAHFQLDREGVLLLTNGYGMRDSAEPPDQLVQRLHQLKFAGVVFSIGSYWPPTPAAVRQAADALDFPIIELPGDTLFIAVAELILQEITNEQNRLLTRSTHINELLTNLVLRGGDLQELVETMAHLLRCSNTIESTTYFVLASATVGPTGPARSRSTASGRTPADLVAHLRQEGVYRQLRQTLPPVRVPPIPALGLSIERIVAPIVVNKRLTERQKSPLLCTQHSQPSL